jgi:hypothetical protein
MAFGSFRHDFGHGVLASHYAVTIVTIFRPHLEPECLRRQ